MILLSNELSSFRISAHVAELGGIKGDQVHLLDNEREPDITWAFAAPVVGSWSPPGKNAPFVCIEPLRGYCCQMDYSGKSEGQDRILHLAAKETSDASYTIFTNKNFKPIKEWKLT